MNFTYIVKKGDTLGAIARKHGFSNYKSAGITSVPSGNFDLIRPGEKITLNNYDPNKVSTGSATTPPVVSSKDHSAQFTTNRNNLNDILSNTSTKDSTNTGDSSTTDTTKTTATADAQTGTQTDTQTNNNTNTTSSIESIYNNTKKAEDAQIATATEQMNTEKSNYLNLINTRLAEIDSTTKSTIANITQLAQSRIDEQTKINQINNGRIKAYGLANGGLYEPMQYTSAVTQQEQAGAQAVAKIEQARNTAISQAQNASRQGKSTLLAEKMDTVSKLEDKLRSNLIDIQNESMKKYNMLIQVRKEKQAQNVKDIQDMQKRIASYVALHSNEYTDMSTEDMSTAIHKIMVQTNLNFAQAYTAINSGIESQNAGLKTELTKAKIEGVKAQTAHTNAETKTEATKQYKNIKSADKTSSTEKVNTTMDKFAENFIKGKSLKVSVDGKEQLVPILDSSGNMTPIAWKSAISEANQNGVSREAFLKRFGHLIVAPDGTVSPKYNLTPGELKKINATERGVTAPSTSDKSSATIQ